MSGTEGPMRIGDQEREDAVTRLGAHYEAGRLSAEEHQERVGEALQAKTEADLAALFTDLPGEGFAGTPGVGGPGEEQGWAGPWGWARPPWTAPSEHAEATAPGAAGAGAAGAGGAAGRAAYGGGSGARGPWGAGRTAYGPGFFGRVPLPVLIALAMLGVLATIGCVVVGGHPPFLPLLLVVAGIFIVNRRRQERRA